MILETSPNILRAHPQYLALLTAYLERDQRERIVQEEFTGWLSRINQVDDIEHDQMSRIHGKLISLGLLKFELGDRFEGIRYQVSDEARRALRTLEQSPEHSHEQSDELEETDLEMTTPEVA